MFKFDLTDARDLARKLDKKDAFDTWALTNLPPDGKFLRYENGNTSPFKGKTHTFVATSWGDYQGSDGVARRFVAYRAPVVNHTIVYTWKWDGEKWLPLIEQQFIQM